MKWLLNEKHPKEGDIRVKRKFAWFPTLAIDEAGVEYKVWLETYLISEVYKKVAVNHGSFMGWELRWVEYKRNTLYWEYE